MNIKGFKHYMYKYSAFIVPALFLLLSIGAITYIQQSYLKTERELMEKESRFKSFELAENMRHSITNKVRILEILAQARPDIFPENEAHYKRIIPHVTNVLKGFYGINWIDPEGYIRWIYPYELNIAALNEKVISRPELTPYLVDARDLKKTTLSHIVDLYQGPKGITIYVPIFHQGKFKGWYNGVINVKESFDAFFKDRNFQDVHVLLKWKGYDDSIYSYGEASTDAADLVFEFQILNQTLLVEVNQKMNSIVAARKSSLQIAFFFTYAFIFLTTISLFFFIRSHFVVTNLNHALSRDKTLLNILVHDMATPLTLILENTKRLRNKLNSEDFVEIDRIIKSSEKQKSLLSRVRSFHAANLGKIRLDLVAVDVTELIDESIALFEDQLKSKEIKFEIDIKDGPLYCLADRVTAINNVLGNVISNAIKFSEDKCKIKISSYREKNNIVIEVEDHGVGISKEILKHLFHEGEVTSTVGTKGEAGTGLGMLQIKTFMDLYKGSVKVTSTGTGAKVKLYFKNADPKNTI